MKKHFSNLIVALRDSYLTLLPFLIVSAVGSLLLQFKNLLAEDFYLLERLSGLMTIGKLFPALLSIALAYQLAKIYQIDRILNITLSLSVLFGLVFEVHANNGIFINIGSHPILALFAPIICSYLFVFILKNKKISSHICQHSDSVIGVVKKNIFAFLTAYFIAIIFLHFVVSTLMPVTAKLKDLIDGQDFSILTLLVLRTFVSHLIWLMGIHGGNTFDLILNNDFLSQVLVSNITAKNFLYVFMLLGGSGCCLALTIAIYFFSQDKHAKGIAKTSLPFVLFNISEIIFYGLPVLFNKKLYVPFLITPLLNFAIIYPFFAFNLIAVDQLETINWATPLLINANLVSQGNLSFIGLQLLVLIIDVLVYTPFVKSYSSSQSPESLLKILESKLSIKERAESHESINFYHAQEKVIQSNIDASEIIKLISNNNLEMYYQPIHNTSHQAFVYFEALLRLKMNDNKVYSPYFLETLEDAGLAWVIDAWVCKQVAEDLKKFGDQAPAISVNLHADTLKNKDLIAGILDDLSGKNIQFELIERASFEDVQLKENIAFIQGRGYSVAIDDFGTGYSSLGNLFSAPSKVIKLDKSFSDELASERGSLLYQHIISMCKDMGFTIVAEGIETQQQMDIVLNTGVDYIQGYFFSQALSLQEAITYVENNSNRAV